MITHHDHQEKIYSRTIRYDIFFKNQKDTWWWLWWWWLWLLVKNFFIIKPTLNLPLHLPYFFIFLLATGIFAVFHFQIFFWFKMKFKFSFVRWIDIQRVWKNHDFWFLISKVIIPMIMKSYKKIEIIVQWWCWNRFYSISTRFDIFPILTRKQ